MSPLQLLIRVFVAQFYTQTAGTWLVIILLAFGFLSANEHIALITATLGSGLLQALVIALWIGYALKVNAFVQTVLAARPQLFLQAMRLFGWPIRIGYWGLVMLGLWLPILAYLGWMLHISVSIGQPRAALLLTMSVVGLLIATSIGAEFGLHHPAAHLPIRPKTAIRLPYTLFFPVYWLRHEPLALLLTKGFSGLLLVGVCRLYPTDDYDQRLLLIGLLLSVLTHVQLPVQVSDFEHRYLRFLPNLPLSRWQRLARYALLYGLIWLPEGLLLLRNCPVGVSYLYLIGVWGTGLGWLLAIHALTYSPTLPERLLPLALAAFPIGLLLIMFGVPVGVWLLVGWGLGCGQLLRTQWVY